MRIGLLSDTHGWLDPALERHFEACDEIWHAGDIGTMAVSGTLSSWKPLRAVWGNIDGHELRRTYPEHQRFQIAGAQVWMTHIAGRPPRYTPEIRSELATTRPTLFICGHSHICLVQFDHATGTLYMNPGAAGRHGWHAVRTALRFRLVEGRPCDLEVIELGPRGR